VSAVQTVRATGDRDVSNVETGPVGWRPDDARIDTDVRVPQLELIIPALNEENRIGPTLAAVCHYLAGLPFACAVIVVDNGSADSTPDVVRRCNSESVPVRLLGCRRAGKGAAVKAGVMAARGTWVGFCDADLATPISTLESVLFQLQAGSPVVIGSRRCLGASYRQHQPIVRRTAGWAFRRMTRSIALNVSDTQCGFKFFDRRTAQLLFSEVKTAGFTFDVEVLTAARRLGIPVVEVPVQWTDQKGSTLHPLEQGLRVLSEVRYLRGLTTAYPPETGVSLPASSVTPNCSSIEAEARYVG
jgi:dolichyl-phosphate beta-glucosyltransferase